MIAIQGFLCGIVSAALAYAIIWLTGLPWIWGVPLFFIFGIITVNVFEATDE